MVLQLKPTQPASKAIPQELHHSTLQATIGQIRRTSSLLESCNTRGGYHGSSEPYLWGRGEDFVFLGAIFVSPHTGSASKKKRLLYKVLPGATFQRLLALGEGFGGL